MAHTLNPNSFLVPPHIKVLNRYLVQLSYGHIDRLMINLAVRHGKSFLTSEIFPAWYLAHFPDHQVGIVSYTHSLARTFARSARDLFEAQVGPMVGLELDPNVQAQAEWKIKGHRGGCYAVGVGGSLVGRGFHCLPAGTMITTEDGDIDIAELVSMRHPPKVLGYDHERGRQIWCRISASQVGVADHLMQIRTFNGYEVRATRDHLVYVEGYGYKPAGSVQRGDLLRITDYGNEDTDEVVWASLIPTVSVVRIYDIQVEGTHNFFANGILVHNCMIFDDPLKNTAEAMSQVKRDAVDTFYRGTAYNRLEPGGKIILIQARYHYDDLAGRLLVDMEQGEGDNWTVLNMPAIATHDEDWGIWKRKKGEPLWPERYDLEALERARTTDPFWFAALFQQDPMPEEGTMFQRDWFPIIRHHPNDLEHEVRYWDFASTEAKRGSDPDYTVGCRYGFSASLQKWIIADIVRVRRSPGDVEKIVQQTAMMDGRPVHVWIEVEPGSSGKSLLHHYQVNVLKGYTVRGHKPTGDKTVRAMPVSALAQSGLMTIVDGAWNREFLAEVDVFPMGAHDDQVDALAGAHDVIATQITSRPKISPISIGRASPWRSDL